MHISPIKNLNDIKSLITLSNDIFLEYYPLILGEDMTRYVHELFFNEKYILNDIKNKTAYYFTTKKKILVLLLSCFILRIYLFQKFIS